MPFAIPHTARQKKDTMDPDNPDIQIGLQSGQAAILLERLETLRSELGLIGEELIMLLRSAGVTPPSEPG